MLLKAGDERVLINGCRVKVDCRIIAEDFYQKLQDKIKDLERDLGLEKDLCTVARRQLAASSERETGMEVAIAELQATQETTANIAINVKSKELDKHIRELFEKNWFGDNVLSSLFNMKVQLRKNLNDQMEGYWSGGSAYFIMTSGGFLVDAKVGTKKGLTRLGAEFMAHSSDKE